MKLSRVFMDADIRSDKEVGYLLDKVGIEPEIVPDSREVYDFINGSLDPVSRAKSILYITRNRGAVIRECPGTSHYTCCDYTILHTGTFCTMDCSYCILQAYFHPPVLQYFAGFDILSRELEGAFNKNRIFRMGTGEYTDSLIWEKISLGPKFLVEKFARQTNSLLELKTKTVNVSSLLDLDHNQKTVLAWSVNTPAVIRTQERGTASLKARLETAKLCQQKGYGLAFHFDPLVIYEGCEQEYKQVVDEIFAHVRPESIVWISMGSFRFMPKLKPIVENRFPDSDICYGEFILGLDNKMRYFKPLRINLYKEVVARIREHAPQTLVYFCMEDREAWETCMGYFPGKEGELGRMLDLSAVEHCRLNSALL
ncbi:SPL family radical SAM protein [Desulfospira joergensenii]|uniref:SPL family radical SAM protein n=1 Tax=Desulfospira joergensenii TaxID=53329 RepID=UPI0003B2EAF2|nr:deoxyribodipyrimidine photo-lyase [Desulfospira joergensenii]